MGKKRWIFFCLVVLPLFLSSCPGEEIPVLPESTFSCSSSSTSTSLLTTTSSSTTTLTAVSTTTTIDYSELTDAEYLGLDFIRSFYGHRMYLFYVDFSPDGQYVVSGSADKTVRVWETLTGDREHKFEEEYEAVWGIPVRFSPDANYIVYGAYDTLKVADISADYEIISEAFAHESGIQTLEISSDSRYVVTGGVDGRISVWTLPELTEVKSIQAHESEIWNVDISPDSSTILSGSEDDTAVLWSFPDLEKQETFDYHTDPIEYVRYSEDGSLFLLACADGNISVWRTADLSEPYRLLRGHLGSVLTALFTMDGQYIISGGDDDCIYVYDISAGEVVNVADEHFGDVMALAISPDQTLLASGSRDRTVKIWLLSADD